MMYQNHRGCTFEHPVGVRITRFKVKGLTSTFKKNPTMWSYLKKKF